MQEFSVINNGYTHIQRRGKQNEARGGGGGGGGRGKVAIYEEQFTFHFYARQCLLKFWLEIYRLGNITLLSADYIFILLQSLS